MSISMSELRQKFHNRQYKLTPQRQTIIQEFIDHPDRHLSAEEIYQSVRQHSPSIGLATVYRTLALLNDLDILQKLDFGNGCHCYEIKNASTQRRHQHLICLSCGKVTEFQDDLPENFKTRIAATSRFTISDYRSYFYGYCQECRRVHNGGRID